MRRVTRPTLYSALSATFLAIHTGCAVILAATSNLPSDHNRADPVVARADLDQLPIKEITIFKDGHAFVLQQGNVAVDNRGRVQLGRLPAPIIGTFWPFVQDDKMRLTSVTAEPRMVGTSQVASSLRELLEANPGAKVRVKQASDSFTATIVSLPALQPDPTTADAVDVASARPRPGEVIILKTEEGHRVIPIQSIQELTFRDEPRSTLTTSKEQNVLTLQLESADGDTPASANVGMVYLQKGVRWIPSYRLELNGQGKVAVRLQATLLNELADLENVTANLVIGVPQFTFKDTLDPISLSKVAARLSPYFQQQSQTALAFSNAIQTQVARMGEHRGQQPEANVPAGPDLGPDLATGGGREDLYIFTLNGISLRKGARMVVPLAEFELPYEDVYTISLGMSPPPEVLRQFNSSQQLELAQLMHRPRAVHKARLTNTSQYPLTTAPAMILREGQLVGQGMMTYTPRTARVDVDITAAVDIGVSKEDVESKRTPNAANVNSNSYERVDLTGKIHVHNYRAAAAKLEVVRYVLGNADSAEDDASVKQLNVGEDGWTMLGGVPPWWHWYNWPYGWFHLNGVGQVTWQFELPAGESRDLTYLWHYFWR